MQVVELHARINAAGTHVVCGIEVCGARMAIVGHPTAEDIARFAEMGSNALACIQFLPGWAPQLDGSWVFSRYAKLRRRRGQSLKVRRYPQDDGTIYNDVMNSYYDQLPVRAKCSACGFVNLLTPAALGVNLIVRLPAEPAKPELGQ